VNKASSAGIWQAIQGKIRERLGTTTYETWFASIVAKTKEPDLLILEVPDEFFKKWVLEHYLETLQDILKTESGQPMHIEFVVNPKILEKATQSKLQDFEEGFKDRSSQSAILNPRFTFDAFVVGPSNRFAHAASLAIVESPAKAYNPFFIWGGVGLGKTHLMQSIANELIQKNPKIKHCYMTSERFTNELIDAIRHRSTQRFRQKYREIDVLLIDDIHFIAGKESTQEEFFHTFNALYDSHKQIVISSDRPPKEIPNLEERLISRFGWGLVTDIQPPDFETRVAILKKKVEREPVQVPEDVIFYIAQQIKTNIRELEGALIRVVAYSLLEERSITLDIAKNVLGDMVKETKRNITIDLIQRRVADYFNLSMQDLKTKRRNKNIVLPRQIAMYLSRELTAFSLPEIGASFGGKDHTTVLHSWNKIKNGILGDAQLKDTVNKIITELKH
jgi:chromosomal replication initiator protein